MYKAIAEFKEPMEIHGDLFNNIGQIKIGRNFSFKKEIIKRGVIRWGGMTFRKLRKNIEELGGTLKVEYTPDKIRDIAIFMSSEYYPTIDSFIHESKYLGSCRRIANLPNDVILGKSKVWLIHDDGYKPKANEDKRNLKGIGKIFSFFVIHRFEAIIDDENKKKELAKSLPVTYFRYSNIPNEPMRGCGYREPGAYYVVGDKDFEKCFKIAKNYTNKFAIEGDLIMLENYLPYSGKRFRGVKYTDKIDEIQNFLVAEKLLSGFEIWEKK